MSGQQMSRHFDGWERRPFADRADRVIGNITAEELSDGFGGIPIPAGGFYPGDGTVLSSHIFSMDDFYHEQFSSWTIGKKDPATQHDYEQKWVVEPVRRWSVGLAFEANKGHQDRRNVRWSYESKDHDSMGTRVYAYNSGKADVGLSGIYFKLGLPEEQVAEELRHWIDYAPYMPEIRRRRVSSEATARLADLMASLNRGARIT